MIIKNVKKPIMSLMAMIVCFSSSVLAEEKIVYEKDGIQLRVDSDRKQVTLLEGEEQIVFYAFQLDDSVSASSAWAIVVGVLGFAFIYSGALEKMLCSFLISSKIAFIFPWDSTRISRSR